MPGDQEDNAVKHFRFRPRGKRRIHEKPGLRHLDELPGRAALITTHPSALLSR